ncbi:MAG: hypothetical protein HZB56_12480 [Deltaproteobacteria bacterium]|nr:hypothetical protein [Deltaproteobacteria bacterium]
MPLVAAALAACDGTAPAPDFQVRGLDVVVATDAPFARRPDLAARIESTVQASLDYWGGGWEQLAGATLTLSGADAVPCAGQSSLGCWDGDLRITTRDPGAGTFSCVEATVLVHEVAHAVIGDRYHTDPRWMQMEPVQAALSGRVGYGSAGEEPCVVVAGVWRHPAERLPAPQAGPVPVEPAGAGN